MEYFPNPFTPFYLFAGLILAIIAFRLFRSLAEWQSNNQAECLEKQACLVTKRQQVSGGGHDTHATTTYYATFEFADKSRLELKVKGQVYGQLAEGDQGKLTYRGTRFIDFQRAL